MGSVYVARTRECGGFERLFALKVPHADVQTDEDGRSMVLDEARIAARIRHPNVVSVLGVPTDDEGEVGLLMDYVEGASLGAVLTLAAKSGVALPPGVVFRFVADVLAGLSAVHELRTLDGRPMQVVHRDVSPSNILIGAYGVARITDFGIASARERLSCTRAGTLKGKIAYMAPERISNGSADARVDVFAVGVVLWEALSGQRLFRGCDDFAAAEAVLRCAIPPLAETRPSLAAIDVVLARALSRDPGARFGTAAAFLDALEAAAGSAGGIATHRAASRAIAPLVAARVEDERAMLFDACSALDVADGRTGEGWDEPTTVDAPPTIVPPPPPASRPRRHGPNRLLSSGAPRPA